MKRLFWALLLFASQSALAETVVFNSVTAQWRDATPTGQASQGYPAINNTNPTNIHINWGQGPSGYDFARTIPATQFQLPTPMFIMGQFTHRNMPNGSPSLTAVKMDVTMSMTIDGQPFGPLTFTFNYNHVETANSTPCQYPAAPNLVPCDDRVTFTASPTPTTFNVGGILYTLQMSFVDAYGTPVAQYYTEEGFNNVATLVGAFTVVGGSANHPPVAVDQSVTAVLNTPRTIVLSGSDIDGQALTYTIVSLPLHGTIAGAGTNRLYTPAPGYTGPDVFTFRVNDGTLNSNLATVSITVAGGVPSNTPPVASDQSVSTPQDTNKPLSILGTDVDNDPLVYIIVNPPLHGTLTGANQYRDYKPFNGYVGPDSFTFKVNDGTVDSNIATVSIGVTAVNHAPVAQAQSVSTNQDTAVPVGLVATDQDGNTLSFTIMTQPAHGTLTGSGASRTYTPATCYSGSDSFTFRASDGLLDSTEATVTITVVPVAPTPVSISVSPKSAIVNAGHQLPFTFTVKDQCGAFMSGVTVTWQASGGSIFGTPGSSAASFTAPSEVLYITITATTNNNKSDSATVRIVSADAGSSLAGVKVGPNPYKSNSGLSDVSFFALPPDSKVRIFTMSGVLVRELDFPNGGTPANWNVHNGDGKRVASGVYLYIIDNGSNQRKGKLVIIQ